MAKKYSLEVNFSLPRYEVGEVTLTGVQLGHQLEGEVMLISGEDINCRGIWMEIGYHERGNGTPQEGRLEQIMIFKGNLLKGKPFVHRILFDVPPTAPMTYSGEYIKYIWFVRIRIDIPFWFDKREEFEFAVIPRLVRKREEIDFSKFPCN